MQRPPRACQCSSPHERIACVFDTASGPMAIVLVGALFVGSMSLAWRECAAEGRRKPRDLPFRRPDHRARSRRRARLVQHGFAVVVLFLAAWSRPSSRACRRDALRVGEAARDAR